MRRRHGPTARTIEQLFRALAALIESPTDPADEALRRPAFATVLLITREFMHHLGYRQVLCVGDAAVESADPDSTGT